MTFSIGFESPPALNVDLYALEARGYLLMGAHREPFIASLSLWKELNYWKHWKMALARVVEGASRSCLITSLYDPATANFIEWWPMYRHNQNVHIQNHLLFLTELKEEFDIEDPFRFVPDYRAENEDGDAISEWIVTVDAISLFLASS